MTDQAEGTETNEAAEAGEAKVRAPSRERRGLLVVYTGNGKGKTTAALGMVFRALGRGFRVTVVQFIKGKWKTGERVFAEKLPDLRFHVMGLGFTWESDDLAKDKAAARAAWDTAKAEIESGDRDLVVLDELTYTIHYGFLELSEVLAVLRGRPAHVHVVVTGRNAAPELIEAADLVSEMTLLKHPYESGQKAQIGVDF
jgi:cob(I)alamin adenosyltransferase